MTKDSKEISDLEVVVRLMRKARPYWLHLGAVLAISLAATPLWLLAPLPLKVVVDSIVGSAPLPSFLEPLVPDTISSSSLSLLILVAVSQVLIVLLIQLQNVGLHTLRTWTGEKLALLFRAEVFQHIQRLSLTFHDAKGSGESIFRIHHDASAIQWITTFGVIPLLSNAVMLICMLAVMASINLELALVALFVSPFLFLSTHLYRLKMRSSYREAKELESTALKVIQETFSAVRVVKAFGREDSHRERFVDRSSAGLRARVRLSFAEGSLSLVVNVVSAVGAAGVLFLGVRAVLGGGLTLGELLMVMAYLNHVYGPLKAMSNTIGEMQRHMVSAHRAFEILGEAPDVEEKADAKPLHRAKGKVEFRGVGFDYDEGRPVLQDVNLTVDPGSIIGVTGKTGEGKTTLINLLTRFYDPTSGAILLDGIDLREYRLGDLRRQFAIVLQEPVLFSTTIAENIAYGRPGAHREEVLAAAKAAKADDFIKRLPNAYETAVGERGIMLSGGERQRLSLARAYLKDAPILLLDEPTSSVDVNTEDSIVDVMAGLMKGRTTILISHRPSALKYCDRLLRLAGRQVREVSTPHEIREKAQLQA